MFVRKPSKRSISLVPMIDVLLCLLIFFMLSSQFIKYQAINVAIAQRSDVPTAVNENENRTVSLKVIDSSSFVYEKKQYPISRVIDVLNREAYKPKHSTIILALSEKVDTQALVDVMSALNGSGFSKIHLEQAHV